MHVKMFTKPVTTLLTIVKVFKKIPSWIFSTFMSQTVSFLPVEHRIYNEIFKLTYTIL